MTTLEREAVIEEHVFFRDSYNDYGPRQRYKLRDHYGKKV